MDHSEYKNILKYAPFGYAYHKIILNDNNVPVDYKFIEVNSAFEKHTGLKAYNVIDKKVTEVIPGITKESFDWIAFYGEVAVNGGKKEFEQYFEEFKRWYKIDVYSPKKYYFVTFFIDITADKEVDEKTKANHERLLSIFDANTNPVYVADPETYELLYVNRAFEKAFGHPGQKKCYEHLQNRQTPCPFCTNDKILGENFGNTFIWDFQNESNHRWYRCVDKAITWPDGRTVRYEMAIDITDQKNLEDALKKSEEKYRLIFEYSPLGLFYFDENGIIVDCNDLFVKIIGSSREALIGLNLINLSDKKLVAEVKKTLKNQTGYYEDIYHSVTADKSTPVRVIFAPVIQDEPLLGGVGIIEDMTERKLAEDALRESEEKHSTTLQSIVYGVIAADENGFIDNMNEVAEKLCSYSLDEAKGKQLTTVFNIVNSETRKTVENPVKKVIESGSIIGLANHTLLIAKDGSEYQITDSTATIRNKEGVITGVVLVFSDVTEEYKKEKALQKSATRLSFALNATNDGIFNWNLETNEAYFSPQYYRMLGYKPNEFKANYEDWKKLIHPDDIEDCERIIQNSIAENKSFSIEYRAKTKDGRWKWLNSRGKVMEKNSQGKAIRIVGTHTDINERKEIEEELHLQSLVLNQITDHVTITDLEGKITYVNQAQIETFGFSKDKLIGQQIQIFGENQAKGATQKDIIEKTIKHRTWRGEIINYDKDGNEHIMDCRTQLINDSKGKPIAICGVSNDITEYKKIERALKTSEKKHRTLLENVFDGIYLLHGRYFEYVNKQFCNITGYSEEELLDEKFDFSEILTEKGKQVVEQRYAEREKGENLSNVYEFQIKTKPGKIKDIEVSTTNLTEDKAPRILGVIRDITEKKKTLKLENEVLVAQQSAEFKQKFLANMSHEIRTPLTGILGFTDILANTELSEKQKQYIDILQQSGEKLREIINLILDYSKIESGQISLKPVIFATKTMFDDVTSLFHSICQKDIELKTSVSQKIPKYIKTDKQRLNQILSNLLSNAVKFTEKGTISIDASLNEPKDLSEKSEDNNSVIIKIEVKDTGAGIKPEAQKHLFKPFFQTENDEIQNIQSTGLGLAICKELTEILGGEIGVKSEPGKGSNFWFTFSANIAKEEDVKAKYEEEKHVSSKTSPLKILLVEDSKVNQMVVSLLLEDLGHTIDVTGNGAEALEKYKPGVYDLILMDIQMPVMDGITATNKLKQKHKQLPPIVGLSAYAFESDREKYMQKGLDEYLVKPIQLKDFENVLKKLGIIDTKSEK